MSGSAARPNGGNQPSQKLAAFTILASAASFALSPSIIHLTVQDNNPFLFGVFLQASQAATVVLFLILTKKRFLDQYFLHYTDTRDTRSSIALKDASTLWYLRQSLDHFRTIRPEDSATSKRVTIESATLTRPSTWIYVPLVWALIGSLEYGLFVWSTQYVETAVAATVYELWPLFLVFGIERYESYDAQYRNAPTPSEDRNRTIIWEHRVLMILAAVGLAFMWASQNPSGFDSLSEMVSFDSIFGMTLAFIAAALASLYILATFVFGKTTYYRLLGTTSTDTARNVATTRERARADQKLLLWLTLLGLAMFRIASLPLNLVIGMLAFDFELGITGLALIGATIIGVTNASGAVLLRVGNIGALGPGTNALFFLSPIAALGLLVIIGVSLPRFDMYVLGAALILAINILIQLKPDTERDYSRFGKSVPSGTRLGFTSFIMSIWAFGTILYLRDEIFPDTWLAWADEEYWSVIALSATVFALVLGFRIARLSARISMEDEAMLSLFRDCEHLVGSGLLDEGVLGLMADLDTAKPKELLVIYNGSRQELILARNRSKREDDVRSIRSIEKQLDTVVHSKQQGRDIVELLSLMAFAAVTIGLGLLSRPDGLDPSRPSWNGFLSEVFVLVFVSTVAFLCANLFDIRRDREAPLLVSVEEFDYDHRLFFRHGRDLTAKHIAAVLISLTMSATFCVLLYDKWL